MKQFVSKFLCTVLLSGSVMFGAEDTKGDDRGESVVPSRAWAIASKGASCTVKYALPLAIGAGAIYFAKGQHGMVKDGLIGAGVLAGALGGKNMWDGIRGNVTVRATHLNELDRTLLATQQVLGSVLDADEVSKLEDNTLKTILNQAAFAFAEYDKGDTEEAASLPGVVKSVLLSEEE